MTEPLRKVLICGTCRSGTSITASILNMHPEAVSTNELTTFRPADAFAAKLAFFRDKFKGTTEGLYLKMSVEDVDEMVAQGLALNTVDKRVGFVRACTPDSVRVYADKMPEYTKDLNTVWRFVDRIVFIIRDPRDVIQSQVSMYQRLGDQAPGWAQPTVLDCLVSHFAWHTYVDGWDEFRYKSRTPTFVLRYHTMTEQVDDLADFVGIDRDRLREMYAKHFTPKRSQWKEVVPQVADLIPSRYVHLAKKHGVWLD